MWQVIIANALLYMVLLFCPSLGIAENPQRGVALAPGAVAPVPITGEYWALIIGIDKYQYVDRLETPVRDATAIRDTLIERYGFHPDNIKLLVNEQATRAGIERALYRLRKDIEPADSVFIYYAGHGLLDDDLGYWVPVDGRDQSPDTYINNSYVRDQIGAMKAKHVYLVADSCFSGSLFAKSRALLPLNDKFYARLYERKSRWGLTSGMNEPVADTGKDGHSMFAYFFLKLLRENEEPYLVPSHIYDQLAPLVTRNTDQQPRSQPLQSAGDEGGQFVFRLPSASERTTARPIPPPMHNETGLASPPTEKEPERVLIAKIPAYDVPHPAIEEISGSDGAPMVLIPAGEFTMGIHQGEPNERPAHRVSLNAFYIDKYEVTTSLYAQFLEKTKRPPPEYWDKISKLSDENRPVIGVNWHDATDYCQWAGKRLPTEAEWEKAARGGDERLFPWGNGAPTRRHANFGTRTWNGYAILSPVGELESGVSVFGVHDMAGNVWEWVADWFDPKFYKNSPSQNPAGPMSGNDRVLRGGSWSSGASGLRSTIRHAFAPSYGLATFGFRCAQDARK
nr:SUMF1/EgtB/PvdO family nonheme iron enzyme [Nitrospirota bacterium]